MWCWLKIFIPEKQYALDAAAADLIKVNDRRKRGGKKTQMNPPPRFFSVPVHTFVTGFSAIQVEGVFIFNPKCVCHG